MILNLSTSDVTSSEASPTHSFHCAIFTHNSSSFKLPFTYCSSYRGSPGEGNGNPTPILSPGEFHGWRATIHAGAGAGVGGRVTESDTTWQLNQTSKTLKHIEI